MKVARLSAFSRSLWTRRIHLSQSALRARIRSASAAASGVVMSTTLTSSAGIAASVPSALRPSSFGATFRQMNLPMDGMRPVDSSTAGASGTSGVAEDAGGSHSQVRVMPDTANNRDKNFSNRKIEVRRQQLEHSIKRYLAELDRADRQPELVLPERVSRLQQKVCKIKEQMRELGQMEQRLQATGERQVSLTDPDARSMATSRLGSAVVGYNVQAAVDAKHHMIVAHEVTNSITDQGQLPAMAKATKEAIAHPKPTVLADRGYFEGYDILECEQAGIETLVPKPLTSNSKFHGRFDKRDFIYDASRDVYRCPAGQIAIHRFTTVEDGKTLRKYWTSACPSCHLKPQCTPAPYRRISRWEHEAVLEAVQARLDAAPEASRVRQRTVEHVFGTLKAWMGSTHFLTRTLPRVRTEMSLQVLAYNMQRAIKILGAAPLIAEMRA